MKNFASGILKAVGFFAMAVIVTYLFVLFTGWF